MAFSKQLLALCFALFAVSVNASIDLGKCPAFETVQDFKADKYVGTWYEYAKYPFIFEAGGKCITATYGANADGTFSVVNTQINELFGNKQTIEGTAEVVGNGKLSVKFSLSPYAPYWVLDTDYDNYAVVWSCTQVGPVRQEVAWILTRNPFPSDEVLGKAIAALLQRGLSTDKLIITNQNSCDY